MSPPARRSAPADQNQGAPTSITTDLAIVAAKATVRNLHRRIERPVGCVCGCRSTWWHQDEDCTLPRPAGPDAVVRLSDQPSKYDFTGVMVWTPAGLRCLSLREYRRWAA